MTRYLPGLGVFATGLFVASALYFAWHQAIWIDETTQLSGLSLDPGTLLSWLAGRIDPGFGVPPDRMPPGSYLLGWFWSRIFGLTEMSMRVFGLVAVLAAVPALWGAGRLAAGPKGGAFVLAFTLLGPGMIIWAVEIRAYPLFFTAAAWSVYAMARLLSEPAGQEPPRLWAGFACAAVAAAYLHFFGVVMAANLFLVLFLDRLWRGQGWGYVVAWGLACLVAMGGLWPFIDAARALSAGSPAVPDSASALGASVRLGARLVLHPAHLIWPVIAGLTALGVAALAALALFGAVRRAGHDAPLPRHVAALVLTVLGGTILPLGLLSTRFHGFEATAPHYNIWMLPVLAFGLAAGLDRFPRAGAGAAILALTGQIAGSAVLLKEAALFSHGPGEWVAEIIETDTAVIVLHEASGTWAHVYFPLVYLGGEQLRQGLQADDGTIREITPGGLMPWPSAGADLAAASAVYNVGARFLDTEALARIARDRAECARLLGTAKGERYCAFVAARIERVR